MYTTRQYTRLFLQLQIIVMRCYIESYRDSASLRQISCSCSECGITAEVSVTVLMGLVTEPQ